MPALAVESGDGAGSGGAAVSVDLSGVENGLSGVSSRLDTLDEDVKALSEPVASLGDQLGALAPDVLLVRDSQADTLAELRSLRSDVGAALLDESGASRLDSIDANVARLVEIQEPVVVDGEEPPFMTLDDVGRLLMVNTGCLAVLIGIKAFELFWSAVGGLRG